VANALVKLAPAALKLSIIKTQPEVYLGGADKLFDGTRQACQRGRTANFWKDSCRLIDANSKALNLRAKSL
jgi:hypothetical protein